MLGLHGLGWGRGAGEGVTADSLGRWGGAGGSAAAADGSIAVGPARYCRPRHRNMF